MIGTDPQVVVFHHQNAGTRRTAVPKPKKYPTEEERREAVRQSQRKYYNASREAISAKRAKAYKRKRAATKAGQK
jgi:hypothetical protein